MIGNPLNVRDIVSELERGGVSVSPEIQRGYVMKIGFFPKTVFNLVALSFLMTSACWARPPIESSAELDRTTLREFFSIPVLGIIQTYRKFASKGRASFCPMTPSCSTYGLETVRRQGPFFGTLRAIDRLNRCGHDLENYEVVFTDQGLRYRDERPEKP